MPTNLERAAVSTGLKKISFHSNSKESQRQRMFKLSHNCTHLTCQQSNAQNSPSQASIVCELRTSIPDVQTEFRKSRGIRDQIAKISWIIQKAREFQKISTSASLTVTNKKDHKRLISVTKWITQKTQVKFLEIHNLPKLNYEERENLNITITSKETESLIKTSQ